jgi:hypothetical protein
MQHGTRSRTLDERGAIAITATFFALAICGVALAFLSQVDASKKLFDRGESSVRALEAAETGVARAEEEISSQIDTGTDGIGNLSGTIAGASFDVTATQDAVVTNEWILRARGTQGDSQRRLEVRVRRLRTTVWNYGIFAATSISISGGASTDSYDSRLGSYASQAKNSDSYGSYAGKSAPVGANGAIGISKGEIRGDSNAGPGFVTSLSGTGVVTGSTTSLKKVVPIPDTPLAAFVTAATKNDDGAWTTTGGTTFNAVTKALSVSSGNTLVLTKGTYFFSSITLTGGSKIQVASGDQVTIYITDSLDLSGGTMVNMTETPAKLQIYQEPYALPVGFVPTKNQAKLTGNSSAAFVYYGPSTPVDLGGQEDYFGAIIGKSINASGAARVHYDVSLHDDFVTNHAPIRRIYWRDVAPPQR